MRCSPKLDVWMDPNNVERLIISPRLGKNAELSVHVSGQQTLIMKFVEMLHSGNAIENVMRASPLILSNTAVVSITPISTTCFVLHPLRDLNRLQCNS